jgi:Tol biopolymer transport system component
VRPYTSPRVSLGGERLALFLEESSISIWMYEIARDTLSRVTFGDDDHNVAWSPDGTRFAFASVREGVHQIFIGSADGSRDLDQVTDGEHDHYLCDWSPDGRALAYVEFHPETAADLWVVELSGTREPRAFVNTRFYEKEAAFSPDGRWLAYVSDESGQFEVYVQPFSGPGPKLQVSSDGGEEPVWSRAGDELFYRANGKMMTVAVRERPELTVGRPEPLFEDRFHDGNLPSRSYDVAPDGRFVMAAEAELERAIHRLEVVLNWTEGLKATIP